MLLPLMLTIPGRIFATIPSWVRLGSVKWFPNSRFGLTSNWRKKMITKLCFRPSLERVALA